MNKDKINGKNKDSAENSTYLLCMTLTAGIKENVAREPKAQAKTGECD